MPLAPEKFEKLRRAGDLASMVDFFLESTEADRRPLEKAVLTAVRNARFLRAPDGGGSAADGSQWDRDVYKTSRIAALACASWPKLAKMNWNDHDSFSDSHQWTEWWLQVLRLFEALRPSWLDAWADLALKQNIAHWFFVRELIRKKLCRKPACDEYTLGLMQALRWRFHTYVPKKDRSGGRQSKFATIADALLDDSDLLKEDIWRLFAIEGTSDCNLQSLEPTQSTNWKTNEKIPADVAECSWRHALVQLAQSGHLARARLLDASLAAVARDFAPHRAGWFFRLHDLLAPTEAERTQRVTHYLRLIANANPNVSAWALQTVATMDKIRPLTAAALLENLEPALEAKSKGGVKSALQLLGRIATREPKQRSALLQLAITALLNPTADVQLAVFKLLDQYGDKSDSRIVTKLREHAESVVPSVRVRLAEWTATTRMVAPQAAAINPSTRKVPRLDPSRRIAPIESFDELLDRAAFALTNPSAIEEVERVLDGFTRLGAQRPADFAARTGPLRQGMVKAMWPHLAKKKGLEARQLLETAHAPGLASVPELLGVTLESWCVGKDLFPPLSAAQAGGVNQVFRFLFHRLHAITRLVNDGISLPLLSAPTHRGGWIEPASLLARMLAWQQAKRSVDASDFCLALLRLAPEGREPTLARMGPLKGEAADALRYALGAENVRVGKTAEFWIAAARARSPGLDDPAVERAHPQHGPDAGCASRLIWLTERTVEHFKTPLERTVAEAIGLKPNPNHAFTLDSFALAISPPPPAKLGRAPLPVLLHGTWDGDGFTYREETELLRWGFTLWPASREPIFGALALWLMAATQSFTYREAYRHGFMQVAFEAFNDPHTRPGPMGTLLHAFALLSPDPECRGLGVDAFASLVETNRFSAEALGVTLARLLPTTLCKLTRLTPALAEVARISPAHAGAVRTTIEEMLAGDPTKAPRDVGTLLELMVELTSAAGTKLASASARDYLNGLPRQGRTPKLVKRLLNG